MKLINFPAFFILLLQGLLVTTAQISVKTEEDSSCSSIGLTTTPGRLSKLNPVQAVNNLTPQTINGMLTNRQPNLWSASSASINITNIAAYLPDVNDVQAYQSLSQDLFMAALPTGTDTGLNRNVALRMNNSIFCETVPQSSYPLVCKGPRAFEQTFSNIKESSNSQPFSNASLPRYRARVCMPGQTATSPWIASSHRQDTAEEFWLDFEFSKLPSVYFQHALPEDFSIIENFTQHCHGGSTHGYFELPYSENQHTVGPMIDNPQNSSNDSPFVQPLALLSGATGDDSYIPDGEAGGYDYDANDPDHVDGLGYPVMPSPFKTAVLSIFGNDTFFNTIATNSNITQKAQAELALCRQLRYPFWGLAKENLGVPQNAGDSRVSANWEFQEHDLYCDSSFNANDEDDESRTPDLLFALFAWMLNFADPAKTMAAMTLTIYAAQDYALSSYGNLLITKCNGVKCSKPEMHVAAMVVITILLAVQIFGLAFLVVYTHIQPAWTETLDAFAILKIGAEVGKVRDLSGLDVMDTETAKLLDETEGWVDKVGEEKVHRSQVEKGKKHGRHEKTKEKSKVRRLVLGGLVQMKDSAPRWIK